MTPFDFILIGLATWRVSSLLVQEDGPFDIFQRLRDRLGVYPAKVGDVIVCRCKYPAFGMFCCVWCMSVWVSVGMILLYRVTPFMVQWLAISTLAIVVQELIKRDRNPVRPSAS